MNIQIALDHLISNALNDELNEQGQSGDWAAIIKQAQKPEFGHYQANGIMAAAKRVSMNPRALAEAVKQRIHGSNLLTGIDIAGPGFINLRLSDRFIEVQLQDLLGDPRLGAAISPSQKVVIDYSSPNLAKEMHIGHLRSTTIGDCIARMLEFQGHQVIRANHMGDWGSQFGSLLAYMHRLSNDPSQLSNELEDLEAFYQQSSALFKTDDEFAAEAREYVVRLQSGDQDCLALWQQFISVSVAHCQKIYSSMNITLAESDVKGESFYKDLLPEVVSDLEATGLLVESEGALCVFMDEFKGKDGSPLPAIVRKSDGGYPYLATDLAAVKYRSCQLNADRAYYFIDSRQSLHLQQLFAICRHVGYLRAEQDFKHVPNGTIMGEDGKPFKTRTGGAVKLADVLVEANNRARVLIDARSNDLTEVEKTRIADVVGIGAVKYAELSKNRTSDYIFNWESMLSFEGNTAPYLQYAYTRIQSIFRTAELDLDCINHPVILKDEVEKRLALKLLQYPEALDAVTVDCMPNLLCNYLFELAGAYMGFYERCPVLKAQADLRNSRLVLCALTARVLRSGLNLLGIDVIDRM